jgi:protein involved in polysaccharide export with SLBB domain
MSKRGISKSQVLQKINQSTTSKSTNEAKVVNNVDTSSDVSNNESSVIAKSQTIYANPLTYKGNAKRISEIKSNQNNIKTSTLKRFSKTFFTNKNRLTSSALPVPAYYIINKNDTVSIWVYGGVNKNITSVVDNNGNINIETFGPIKVAGLEFAEASKILKAQLSKAFGGANVAVNISSYSTIQVTLTGDVYGAGIYNVQSLSTIKDLLIIAGGVKSHGSVRDIIIKRDGDILKSVDFYELLIGNNDGVSTLLRSGDIVFVPKANKIVSLSGAVVNPAKFELKDGEKLDSIIKYSGGLLANASKVGMKIEGFDSNEKRKVKTVNFKDIKTTTLNDSDKIYVYTLDKIQKENVYLYGNVVRPGSREFISSLSDMLKDEISYLGLKGVFLEDTLFSYGLIKSKNNDLSTRVSRFNLADVISNKADVKLNIDDEIYIFNKLDSQLNPYVMIKGSVVAHIGEFQYYQGLTVADVIQIAGVKAPYDTSKIKVVTYNTKDLMPLTKIIDIKEASNYTLSAYDEIELYDYYDLNQISVATIKGEVNLPKEYNINSDMTLGQLIITAGGLTQKAYKKSCEIIRYHIVNDEREKEIINISLVDADTFKINNFDEITIKTIPKWSERKTITLKGEVKFPGTYIIEQGDKLSDVLQRAGGFTNEAFIYGAVFSRESIKQLQKKRLRESLLKLKQKAAAMSSAPKAVGQADGQSISDTASTIDSLSKEAEALQPIGRVTIKLDNDLESFTKSSSNLTLKDKDELIIPSFNDTILVMGQVMNPTAIIYDDDDVAFYLAKAGGLTQLADDDNIYVIHANGEAKKYTAGIFLSGSVSVKAGDVIIVPQELITSTGMQFAKDISGILYQFAVTTAALSTVGAL